MSMDLTPPNYPCLTVCAEVVIEYLEEREGVPGVWVLESQHGVHVHGKQGPEQLAVLHQEVAEPCKRLNTTIKMYGVKEFMLTFGKVLVLVWGYSST